MAMRATIQKISPRRAAWILRYKNSHNRDSTLGRIALYAEAMKAGKWVRTHQAIAFGTNGILIDGAHRLRAQVISGTTQTYVVVTGCDPESQFFVDDHRPRTPVDVLKLDGVPNSTPRLIAAARVFATAPEPANRRMWSKANLKQILSENVEALMFAQNAMPDVVPLITIAPVYALVARAWGAKADQARLTEFGKVLLDGESNGPEDRAAIMFREFLKDRARNDRLNMLRGGQQGNAEIYQKGQNALKHFLARSGSLKKLNGISEDLFPLPEGRDYKTIDRGTAIGQAKSIMAKIA